MPPLNDAQQRHLRITFQYVDRLLASATSRLAAADPASPFDDCVPDATPLQAKVIADAAQDCRRLLLQGLADFAVPVPGPQTGAVWSARTAIMSADIALEELAAKGMRGYGELAAPTAERLTALVTSLQAQVRQMARYLGHGATPDLPAPSAEPDGEAHARAETGGPSQDRTTGAPEDHGHR